MRLLDAPLTPDAGEGQSWLGEELAKSPYAAAKPTPIDELGKAIWDWLQGLMTGSGSTPPIVGVLVILGVLVVALAIVFLITGLPHADRRIRTAGALFSEAEGRSAAELRADAAEAARHGDWPTAIAERYRAIARGLDERGLVVSLPGTTAHEFARRAATRFPEAAAELATAADAFDGVRYLGEPGSPEQYATTAALDERLRAASAAAMAMPAAP